MTFTMSNIMLAVILITNVYLVYKIVHLFFAVKYSVDVLDRKIMLLVFGMEEQRRLQMDEETFGKWQEICSTRITKRDQQVKEWMSWGFKKWFRYHSDNPADY